MSNGGTKAVLCGLVLLAMGFQAGTAAGAGTASGAAARQAPAAMLSDVLVVAQASDKKDDLLLSGDDDLLKDTKKDDDLLSGGTKKEDSLLSGTDDKAADGKAMKEAASEEKAPDADAAAAHVALFAESRYPSANTCKVCHPKQYDQWSVSQHAYAQMSPVYMAFQNTINALTSATNGDFCIRCHNQVGMNMGESTYISNLDRHPTSREGITCVVCHRLNQEYGKVSGRVALVEGDLLTPVFGPKGNAELKRVLDNTHEYRVVTKPDEAGRKIHTEVGKFTQLSTSAFCGVCHDVNLFNGFRLEEAFSEYKNSPAAAENVSCQDCHMGKIQGKVSGYDEGPAAEVGGVPTRPRKLTNHFFAGPDYSVIHPGIFPHNAEAAEFATLREWLQFDYEAGWGTDKFEDTAADNYEFPDRWASIDDRYDARDLLERQFRLLKWAEEKRLEVLRNGYGLGDIRTVSADGSGLRFDVEVKNLTNGHNVPTGFDAERLVWLEVTVMDPAGKVVFRSGDLDPNGDLRDLHSLYVHNGELPQDDQLFSLQSRFVTRNVRGGEREQVLAINLSLDALPFVRPSTNSTVLTGQPGGARKHRQTMPPLSSRWHSYKVSGGQLGGPGQYSATVRLKSAMVPVNLIDAIKGVGFDYGMSPREIADQVVAGHMVLWERNLTFDVK